MILVIGAEEEYHAKHVYDLLKSKGEDVEYFDTRIFPEDMPLSWFSSDTGIKGYLKINNNKINLQDIKSVYWRWHYGINKKPENNDEDSIYKARILTREIDSAIDSLFESMDCLWVNSLAAIEMHRRKSYQLHTMAQNNIRVPKTLISNDKDELVSFYEENNGQLIYKPVRGGTFTEKVKPEDISKERLDSLLDCPVQFQEFIDGVDVRVYVIGKEIFAAEIQAKTIDFRADDESKIVRVELPENIKNDCFKIMKLLKLNFSGIDIRHGKSGEYVFIEANPAPMFTYFEEHSDYPISECLTEMLIRPQHNLR
ncbi:MAG: hypothetical protein V2B14_03815 [bacterium]